MPAAVPAPTADPTRARLLDSAAQVFAEQGYQAATVREICARAGANVAAVNYYFHDKMALYVEVLRETIPKLEQFELRDTVSAAAPEEALRLMIAAMLARMLGERQHSRFRLVAHEMAQPSPALEHVVNEIIRPNSMVWCGVVSRLIGLPPDHETTRLCATSVVGQVVHYAHARPVMKLLWPEWVSTPDQIDRIASHIAAFSLSAMQAIAKQQHPKTEN